MLNELNTNLPTGNSTPWLTSAIQSVQTSGFDIALERSEVEDGSNVSSNEDIAYLIIEAGKTGSFPTKNTTIDFKTVRSGRQIEGINTCYSQSFPSAFTQNPIVIASKNEREGIDGGWLRQCSLSPTAVGLHIQEDYYYDLESTHTKERVGLMAFSEEFSVEFSTGEVYLYAYESNSWVLKQTITQPVTEYGERFGTSVGIHNNNDGTAEIVVGAPEAINVAGNTGKVFAYSWNGITATLNSTLEGTNIHSRRFGATLDIKGMHLIVGSPDEQTPTQNDNVGAAYTYDFNGTSWGNQIRIKRSTTDERLATHVSISKEGNVSLVASSELTTSSSYIYTGNASSWIESYAKGNQAGGDVDTDDGIHLITQRSERLSFFTEVDGDTTVPRPLNILRSST